MRLDYENAGQLELYRVTTQIRAVRDQFNSDCLAGRVKYGIHEEIVKPSLALSQRDRVLEIGVGHGFHLSSYAGVDYMGLEVDSETVSHAMRCAQRFGLDPERVVLRNGQIPLEDGVVNKIFSICTLHETQDMESELSEMDRVLGDGGSIAIVERMCAISEGEQQIKNLKDGPKIFRDWFGERDYVFRRVLFRATYWGESLLKKPDFQFNLFSCQKP